MTTETPNERRTRLIEQYILGFAFKTEEDPEMLVTKCYLDARRFADAVIAATPQEPEPMRYPSEINSRLLDLVAALLDAYRLERPNVAKQYERELAAIKSDIGLP